MNHHHHTFVARLAPEGTIVHAEAFNLGRSEIVTQLNANGVPCRGQRWHLTTVARVLRTGAVG